MPTTITTQATSTQRGSTTHLQVTSVHATLVGDGAVSADDGVVVEQVEAERQHAVVHCKYFAEATVDVCGLVDCLAAGGKKQDRGKGR